MNGVEKNPDWVLKAFTVSVALFLLSSCTTTVGTDLEDTRSRSSPKYMDVQEQSSLNTVGVESFDIEIACQSMVGKMLANPTLTASGKKAHVILDASYFKVDTASRINKHLLVDLLRTELLKAANGAMVFISREHAEMVEKERSIKREGVVGQGANPSSLKPLGGDYRFGGRIADLTQSASGRVERYTQITFEMIDLETGEIVFADTYRFKKAKSMGILYR